MALLRLGLSSAIAGLVTARELGWTGLGVAREAECTLYIKYVYAKDVSPTNLLLRSVRNLYKQNYEGCV